MNIKIILLCMCQYHDIIIYLFIVMYSFACYSLCTLHVSPAYSAVPDMSWAFSHVIYVCSFPLLRFTYQNKVMNYIKVVMYILLYFILK